MSVEDAREVKWIFIADLFGDGFDLLRCRRKQGRGVIDFSACEFGMWRGATETLKEAAEVTRVHAGRSAQLVQSFDLRELFVEHLSAALPRRKRGRVGDRLRRWDFCRFI